MVYSIYYIYKITYNCYTFQKRSPVRKYFDLAPGAVRNNIIINMKKETAKHTAVEKTLYTDLRGAVSSFWR